MVVYKVVCTRSKLHYSIRVSQCIVVAIVYMLILSSANTMTLLVEHQLSTGQAKWGHQMTSLLLPPNVGGGTREWSTARTVYHIPTVLMTTFLIFSVSSAISSISLLHVNCAFSICIDVFSLNLNLVLSNYLRSPVDFLLRFCP